MKGINKVTLVGTVPHAPEVINGKGGQPVTKFTLITSAKYRDKKTGNTQESKLYHNIVAFGKNAQLLADFVGVGTKMYIEARLDYQTFFKDGVKQYVTQLVVLDFSVSNSKQDAEGNQGSHSDEWGSYYQDSGN